MVHKLDKAENHYSANKHSLNKLKANTTDLKGKPVIKVKLVGGH